MADHEMMALTLGVFMLGMIAMQIAAHLGHASRMAEIRELWDEVRLERERPVHQDDARIVIDTSRRKIGIISRGVIYPLPLSDEEREELCERLSTAPGVAHGSGGW